MGEAYIVDAAALVAGLPKHVPGVTVDRYGLQTMCEGGGQANVTIIERV